MKLKIEVGEEQIVYRGVSREPSLLRLQNGDLLLSFHITPDVHFAKRAAWRSRDGGTTWQEDPPRTHREQATGQGGDGLVLAPDIYTFEQQPGVYIGTMCRSTDGGATFQSPELVTVRMQRVSSTDYPDPQHFPESGHVLAKFYIPLPDFYRDVVAHSSTRKGFIFWRYLLEESPGRWIAAMQGHFHGDRCHRTVLVESRDAGKSWDFVSTIAYNHEEQRDGYCEPALARVADGSLLCVLRRGGELPLGQTRSTDGGRTWSRPRLLEAHGVDPDLCLLSNGVLVCSHGRPGRHLMFSVDGSGHTWGYPMDLGARSGSSYMALAEIAPGRLLVLYDDLAPDLPAGVPRTNADGSYNHDYHRHAYIGSRIVEVSLR